MPQTLEQSYEALRGSTSAFGCPRWRSPPPRPQIFKAYDVRGLYGAEIDGETALPDRPCIRARAGRLRGKPTEELGSGWAATCG